MSKSICTAAGIASAILLSIQVAQAEMTPLRENTFHYFKDGYGSLVLIGDDGVLVVDPAWTSRAKDMKQEIAEITEKPVTHVVLSHEHYDHVGGSEVFEGAEIVCHNTCQKFFDLDVLGGAPEKVTLSFENSLKIDLGNQSVELNHWGSGDGVGTTVVHVPSAKVAALADMYEGPRAITDTMWLEDKNVLGTRLILNKVASWDLNHVLGGHSSETDPQAVREHAEFHNDLYDAVKAALDKIIADGGAGAAFAALGGALPKDVKLPKYADWKGYEEHLPKHVWRTGMSIMHGG